MKLPKYKWPILLLSALLTACSTNEPIVKNQNVSLQLLQKGQDSELAYQLLESLTVEVGPRLPGSPADLQAVNWAVTQLNRLGFDRVYKEAVTVPVWHRGQAHADIVAPYPQPLVITALGGSIATPAEGITADIIRFTSLAALELASVDEVFGKIVFIDHKTERHINGQGYGQTVPGRSKGAVSAAKKGAVAILIRSIGTDSDRMPHTGMMRYQPDVKPIPAAALSNPDADLITAMLKRQQGVRIQLDLSPQDQGTATSYNVIAELTGSSKPEEIVLIGAHLDSWDEGTGALDDGAGVAIVTAAAKLIADLPTRPARTIRVVLFAAEEIGLVGAKQYVIDHQHELNLHYIAAESDFGAGSIYQLDVNVNPEVLTAVQHYMMPLADLGVNAGNNQARGAPDVSLFPALGVPVASLRQDGRDYFDYHHTPNDTLDKVDPISLKQNVAVWSQFTYLMAQSELPLRPIVEQD
ncbi:M20/M25/M40 family metallo-hydrolase [Shewanella sp. NIFS-20-20]|uniref:M20/M25/M40 family metallo-hydrolase n=1 Tax=Shewanella sp. NIFS-20-20 TaxID=2853806 RepID=UPI001C44D83B|nr:M20/M25/M40 family metallo-hydrolase [Shewanella sp. NIFS-20-20]MBV7314191.1 M20/M25/M40 family metallo-hydrolase [Shewanella sp. NIFS-20-20]